MSNIQPVVLGFGQVGPIALSLATVSRAQCDECGEMIFASIALADADYGQIVCMCCVADAIDSGSLTIDN